MGQLYKISPICNLTITTLFYGVPPAPSPPLPQQQEQQQQQQPAAGADKAIKSNDFLLKFLIFIIKSY
jgi:hypothetical protein